MDELPPEHPRYTLAELLAQCEPELPRTEEDKAWLQDPPAGTELL